VAQGEGPEFKPQYHKKEEEEEEEEEVMRPPRSEGQSEE
jgi:hypothetical protein